MLPGPGRDYLLPAFVRLEHTFRQLNYTTAVIRGNHGSILRRALKINAFGTRYASASYSN